MPDCEHQNFHANVTVNRITQGEGGPVGAFVADITVMCADCKLPFRFIGCDMGMHYGKPMVSVLGTELRAPIEPDTLEKIQRLAGPQGVTIMASDPGGLSS